MDPSPGKSYAENSKGMANAPGWTGAPACHLGSDSFACQKVVLAELDGILQRRLVLP